MCRLFGMTTGGPRVPAEFWLVGAPDSLTEQSRREPDGTGLGWFSLGDEPVRDRAPIAAFQDADFAHEAATVTSHTFVAHIRYASTGGLSVHNTHPFDIRDRLFAHNGHVAGLDVINSWLTDADRAFIEGETDSELVFAYLSAEIRRAGDTTAGIINAVQRIGREVPLYALNFIVAEPRKLWAVRYPDTHPLWVLSSDGAVGTRKLASSQSTIKVQGADPVPAVVLASERLDDDPGWRLLESGELLIADGLNITSMKPFDPPAQLLQHSDLSAKAAASQDGEESSAR